MSMPDDNSAKSAADIEALTRQIRSLVVELKRTVEKLGAPLPEPELPTRDDDQIPIEEGAALVGMSRTTFNRFCERNGIARGATGRKRQAPNRPMFTVSRAAVLAAKDRKRR
jgi:hypothetical protein